MSMDTHKTTPTVSVVMSCYHESQHEISRAVESILEQTFHDFEYIIILDDPSRMEIKTLLDKYARQDNRIHVVVQPKQLGLAVGRNTGIDHARGRYVVMMDADDVSVPNRLELQVAWMEAHTCDLLFSYMDYIDEADEVIGQFTPHFDASQTLPMLLRGQVFGHPTACIRRNVFLSERYDPAFIKGQDIDLWIRCIRAGFEFCVMPHKLLRCRLHRKTDVVERIKRQRGYALYGTRIVKKHWRSLWKYPSFWLFATKRYVYYAVLTCVPRILLVGLIRTKDIFRRSQ